MNVLPVSITKQLQFIHEIFPSRVTSVGCARAIIPYICLYIFVSITFRPCRLVSDAGHSRERRGLREFIVQGVQHRHRPFSLHLVRIELQRVRHVSWILNSPQLYIL